LLLLNPYLASIGKGLMTLSGTPKVVKDVAGNVTLDADYLPGPYVVRKAIELLLPKVKSFGVATAAIARTHHIACLQAYLKPVTDLGYVILLMSSDPSCVTVAAHGGVKPVCTPNPIAVGIPTESTPILIDISASTTTNGRTLQLYKQGQKYPSDCLQTADGRPTNDPAVLFDDPPGTILPLGGPEYGYKGFALCILVEALTAALCGHGRTDHPNRWGASVFLQLIDPECFGGLGHFKNEMESFARTCRDSGPTTGESTVRMPGDKALQWRQRQLAEGVTLHPSIMASLQKWAEKSAVTLPKPLPGKVGQ
jgi:LDH2 family malate/lactate/ureidoglycolate dehydrogenase